MRLSRPLYESLPALYALAGAGALLAGYLLRSGWLSTTLSLAGFAALIGGAAIWLRRRGYRATRAEYRLREEMPGDAGHDSPANLVNKGGGERD
jgi:hypothetical protein